MINPEKIRQNLNLMTTAVNGLLSAIDDAEKNAWTVIYNARQEAILNELDNDRIEPMKSVAEPDPEPEATEVAPEENIPEATKFVLDE